MVTFLPNKYTKWYHSIILSAQNRGEITGYHEIHHILPKCLGGDDSINNLVKLTAREHFICHLLLIRMVLGRPKFQMIHALFLMGHSRGFTLNSRLFSMIRENYSKSLSLNYYRRRFPEKSESEIEEIRNHNQKILQEKHKNRKLLEESWSKKREAKRINKENKLAQKQQTLQLSLEKKWLSIQFKTLQALTNRLDKIGHNLIKKCRLENNKDLKTLLETKFPKFKRKTSFNRINTKAHPDAPLCNSCREKPRQLNRYRGEKAYYFKQCYECRSKHRTIHKMTWDVKGYTKKLTCDRCGFKAKHESQIDVFHVNGNLQDARPTNLKSVCKNCSTLFGISEPTWKVGDLIPD